MTPKHSWIGLCVFLAVCFAAGAIGGAVTSPKIGNWYAALAKPSWNPPDWVFGPIWTALYCCMAVAGWLVWRQGGLSQALWPLTLFGVQLVLNVFWSCLFFGLQSPGLAFVELIVLWTAIAATMVMFWQRTMIAGILLLPYLAWVAYAGVLNFALWRLNG
jgi:translocator protein